MKMLDKLKCKLGFHDNQPIGEDLRFMPNVKILLGRCSRCGEAHNFFIFLKSKKILTTNSGIQKLFFGEYLIMPLEAKK